MPNGGVPLHMILRPKQCRNIVIYCYGGEMRLYSQSEWDAKKSDGTPMATLTESEGAALAGFLQYWLGDWRLKACRPEPDVDAEYDY
jgi:hypothetical protein